METDNYPLPLTVYRPYIRPVAPVKVQAGELCQVVLSVGRPASDISDEASSTRIYNEQLCPNYSVKGVISSLQISCKNLPEGAEFDAGSMRFLWTPTKEQQGEHRIVFVVDDGLMPEKMQMKITVEV